MNNYVDADFLQNYIQKKEATITVPRFGGRILKIRKLTANETRAMGNIIMDEFGQHKIEKYLPKIQTIMSCEISEIEKEKQIREYLGELDYAMFTKASFLTVCYKVACSTGIDYNLIRNLDEDLVMEISANIDKEFSYFDASQEELKKK